MMNCVEIFASGGDKKSKAMKRNYENFPLVPRGGWEPLYLENLLKILAPVKKLHEKDYYYDTEKLKNLFFRLLFMKFVRTFAKILWKSSKS